MVNVQHRYSRGPDISPQDGMEIPCKYRFVGNDKEIKKVKGYITKAADKSNYLTSNKAESFSIVKHSWLATKNPQKQSFLSPLNVLSYTVAIRVENGSHLLTHLTQ